MVRASPGLSAGHSLLTTQGRRGGRGQLLEDSPDTGYLGTTVNEALPTEEAALALSVVTHQVCRDGRGNQCIGPADQGPTEEQHGCGEQRGLRTEPARPSSLLVRAGTSRAEAHPGGRQSPGSTNSSCTVPGDALPCFPKASESFLFGGPETQVPWPHGQSLMMVLGGREESLSGPRPGQHWVYTTALLATEGTASLHHRQGSEHMAPPFNCMSSFS